MLYFFKTEHIASVKIHSHWTVIQDFERGNFTEAAVEKYYVSTTWYMPMGVASSVK